MKEIPKVILSEGMDENRETVSEMTSSMDVERLEMNQVLLHNSAEETSKTADIEGLLMLPSNLFNFVCMFLKAKEIVNLMRVSRAMREKVLTQAQYAISTVALKLFFSNEIDGYVEYGEEEKYLACKAQRNQVIAEYMKHIVVDHLRDYSQLRSQIQQTPQVAQLDLIFAAMLNPPMPIMKIRRENVGMHAHSWFQNKLVDVYYDNQTKTSKPINSFNFASQNFRKLNQGSVGVAVGNGAFGSSFSTQSGSVFGSIGSNTFPQQSSKSLNQFGSSHKKLKYFSQTISEIQQKLIRQKQLQQPQQQQQLLGILQQLPIHNSNQTASNNNTNYLQQFALSNSDQINQQKVEKLLDLIRWYRDFDEIALITDSSNPDVQRYIQENAVVLTVLIISTILKKHCQFFHQYLEQNSAHASYFDLISEYNLKWNIYQAAVIEIQENLEEVYKCFNDLYQSEVGVKMYPQYSVLRVAAQHWSRIVLMPLKERLYNSFFSLLQNRRYENLNFVITADQSKIDQKLFSMYYMPEKLENTPAELAQRFQRVSASSVLEFAGKQDSKGQFDNRYLQTSNCNDKMYQEFFSKNSYHVDNILYTFCENMMDLSVNEASVHWLGHTDMQVGHIYSDLHKTFLEKTGLYFEELQRLIFSGYVTEWKQFLMGELKYCRKIVKESTFKLTNKLVLENFFKAFTQETEAKAQAASQQIQQLQQFQQLYNNNEDNYMREKLSSKGLSQLAISYIMCDPRSRKTLESFKAMKDEEEEFNSKSVRDEDIEDINRYRQIKQKLDEDSFAFYDLVGCVDPNLIEKTKTLIRQKLLFGQIYLFDRPTTIDYNNQEAYYNDGLGYDAEDELRERDQYQHQLEGCFDIQDQFNNEVGESLYNISKSSQMPNDYNLDITQIHQSAGFYQNQYDTEMRQNDYNQLSLSGNSCLLFSDLNIKGSSDYLDGQQFKIYNSDQVSNIPDSSDNFFDDIDSMLPNAKGKFIDNRRKNSQDVSTQDNSFNSNEIEEEFTIM